MKQKVYTKVPCSERLPDMNKFVPVIDTAGEIIIYKRVEMSIDTFKEGWCWTMRDGTGNESPNNNLPHEYWLEEVEKDVLDVMTDQGEEWIKLEKPKHFDLDFGQAISLLKKGEKLQRAGWNGKGMFLQLIDGKDWSLPDTNIVPDKIIALDGFIGMKTAIETFVPWLASQTDVLANDWQIFKPSVETTLKDTKQS